MKSEQINLNQEIHATKTNQPLNLNENPPENQGQAIPVIPYQAAPGSPATNSQFVVVLNKNLALPFDVDTDLAQFSQVFITKDFDFFRSMHCFEAVNKDYIVYGLLPDGDKKILFTSRQHFQCCHCCEDCSIQCCLCEYICCDKILFQMDYKRNGLPFYTQGVNVQQGCYCCKCNCCTCCSCCCPQTILFLRENVNPDSKDFNVGKRKGQTIYSTCCGCCSDSVVDYTTQEGMKGSSLRLACCEVCKSKFRFMSYVPILCFPLNLLCIAACCKDVEIAIEGPNGLKTGNIVMPNGCFSERANNGLCFCPNHHFEVNFPPQITSAEKFQIIAEAIHLDLKLELL
jgi:hypothetical protein